MDDMILTDAVKGVPFGTRTPLSRLGQQGWNLLEGHIPLPAAALRTLALDHNRAWMRAYVRETGCRLAPHIKTTMSPELVQAQLADGAWALSVADLRQAKFCLGLGARRILIANQVVGGAELAALAELLQADPGLEVMLLVDSEEGLARLEAVAADHGLSRPISVFVELGYPGGRTGRRSRSGVLSLARRARRASAVRLVGLDLYEGLHQSLPAEDGFRRVDQLLAAAAEVLADLKSERLLPEPCLVTAGGSAFYPEVVARLGGLGAELVLRSGCYIVQDHGLYEGWRRQTLRPRADGPAPALEVWAQVLSRPEPGLVILNAGKRDMGMDAGLPRPILRAPEGAATRPVRGWRTIALSDQHAHVAIPTGDEAVVGDRVAFGVSHPCTTFDKWRLIYLVDDGYAVVGGVRTAF